VGQPRSTPDEAVRAHSNSSSSRSCSYRRTARRRPGRVSAPWCPKRTAKMRSYTPDPSRPDPQRQRGSTRRRVGAPGRSEPSRRSGGQASADPRGRPRARTRGRDGARIAPRIGESGSDPRR
jgi:hypothetical protein